MDMFFHHTPGKASRLEPKNGGLTAPKYEGLVQMILLFNWGDFLVSCPKNEGLVQMILLFNWDDF